MRDRDGRPANRGLSFPASTDKGANRHRFGSGGGIGCVLGQPGPKDVPEPNVPRNALAGD